MGKRNLIKKPTTAHKPFEGSPITGSYVLVLYEAIDESSLDITKPLRKPNKSDGPNWKVLFQRISMPF